MSVGGRVGRLEERSGTGPVRLGGRQFLAFDRWLKSLSPQEKWAWWAELRRPANRQEVVFLEAAAKGLTTGRAAWKKAAEEREAAWLDHVAADWRETGVPPVPNEQQRATFLKSALRRMPAGFLGWARAVMADGLLHRDEIGRMPVAHTLLLGLQAGGALLPDSWLEKQLDSLRRRRKAK